MTGGTGTLGSAVVKQLRSGGHEAVIASRSAADGRVVIDLATGRGIESAVAGMDAIVHAASDPGRHARTTDVDGTRRLAATGVPVLYTSIVGVDQHPFRYYRTKFEGEQTLAANSRAWTVLRATQFHTFIDYLLTMSHTAAAKVPGNRTERTRFLVPRGWQFQPVNHYEVAARIVELLEAGPTNSVEQFAGPEQLSSAALATAWARARGGRPVLFPTVGRIAGAFKDGGVLAAPDVRRGDLTWRDYLNNDHSNTGA